MLQQYCTVLPAKKGITKIITAPAHKDDMQKIKIIITAHAKDDKQIPDGFSFLKTNHE